MNRKAFRLLLAAGLSFLATPNLHAITYYSDYTAVDYSGMTANGGTIIVPMVLTEGNPDDAPFGLSFNITLTVSPITALPGFSDVYNWLPIAESEVSGFYGIGYPDSIYDNLPVSNQNLVPYTINGVPIGENNYDQATLWVNEALSEESFLMNGAFSIAVSALPTTPDGFIFTGGDVRWGRTINSTSDEADTVVYSAMYSRITQFAFFGQTADFEFLAFDSGQGPTAIQNPPLPHVVWRCLCFLRGDSGALHRLPWASSGGKPAGGPEEEPQNPLEICRHPETASLRFRP